MGSKTPLEYAATPTLDRLAREGECGLMDPIAPGIRAGSDTAHLAILGYDPYRVYQGRGPFEALGIGMEVRGGDVALRCNFSTVDAEMRVIDRRAGRITEGTRELAEAVNGVDHRRRAVLFQGVGGASGRAGAAWRGAEPSHHRC
jgi:2,3-bisphosphoglycerate-independent phosphoglycerate mutase